VKRPIAADPQIIRKFDVEVNILQGKISQTQDGAYGSLFIHVDGYENEVNDVVDFIKSRQVEAEVITNV
jgi:D-methionine transport system ATP-binding protein